MTILAVAALSMLSINHRTEQLFASDSAHYQLYTELQALFPHHGQEIVVLVEGDILQPAQLAALNEATRQIGADPDIITAVSITSVPAIAQTLQTLIRGPNHTQSKELVDAGTGDAGTGDAGTGDAGTVDAGTVAPTGSEEPLKRLRARLKTTTYPPSTLISEDLKTTLLVLQVNRASTISITQSEALFARLQTMLTDTLDTRSLQWTLTGFNAIERELHATTLKEHALLGITALLLSAAVMQFFLRHLTLTVLTLAGPVCGLAWGWGICALLGLEMTLLNRTITALLLVITASDALHLTRFLQAETKNAASNNQPVSIDKMTRHCWRVVGPPCLITSITTMAGFLSLLWVDSYALREFGLVAAIVVACGFAASLTLVPLTAQRLSHHAANINTSNTSHRTLVVPHLPKRYDTLVIRLFAGFLLIAALASLTLKPDYEIGENLSNDSQALAGLQLGTEQLGGLVPLSVLVRWPQPGTERSSHTKTLTGADRLRDLRKMTKALNDATGLQWLSLQHLAQITPGITTQSKIASLPPAIRDQVYLPEENAALISTRLGIHRASEINALLITVRDTLTSITGVTAMVDAQPVGVTALVGSGSKQILTSLITSLIVAAITITLLLMILLRSLTLSVTALLIGITPLAAIALMLVLLGEPIRFASIVVFIMMMGLGVDNAVHVIARMHYVLSAGRESGRRADNDWGEDTDFAHSLTAVNDPNKPPERGSDTDTSKFSREFTREFSSEATRKYSSDFLRECSSEIAGSGVGSGTGDGNTTSRHGLETSASPLARQDAVAVATHTVGGVLVLTGLVLLAGFSALLLAQTPTIVLIGVLSMVAVITALTADLTVLPALLRRSRKN